MKKLIALLIVAAFASTAIAAEPAKKAPAKKEVKHHKKAEGTEISKTKPDTVVPKKKK
jgi:hypothetical protein